MGTTRNETAAIGKDRDGQQNQAASSYRPLTTVVKCSACGGHGTRLRRTGFGPEDAIMHEPCEHCEGTGIDIPATRGDRDAAGASGLVGVGSSRSLPRFARELLDAAAALLDHYEEDPLKKTYNYATAERLRMALVQATKPVALDEPVNSASLRARLEAILRGPWSFRDHDQMTALYEQLATLTAEVTRQQIAARALLTSLNGLQFDVSTRAEATRLLVRQLGDASPAGWEIANLTRLLGEGGPEVS